MFSKLDPCALINSSISSRAFSAILSLTVGLFYVATYSIWKIINLFNNIENDITVY